MTFHCLLCGEDTQDITAHVRQLHPDADAQPESWPDGTPVAFEDPDLFTEA